MVIESVEYKRLNHKNFGPRRRGTQRYVLPSPSPAEPLDDAAGLRYMYKCKKKVCWFLDFIRIFRNNSHPDINKQMNVSYRKINNRSRQCIKQVGLVNEKIIKFDTWVTKRVGNITDKRSYTYVIREHEETAETTRKGS